MLLVFLSGSAFWVGPHKGVEGFLVIEDSAAALGPLWTDPLHTPLRQSFWRAIDVFGRVVAIHVAVGKDADPHRLDLGRFDFDGPPGNDLGHRHGLHLVWVDQLIQASEGTRFGLTGQPASGIVASGRFKQKAATWPRRREH